MSSRRPASPLECLGGRRAAQGQKGAEMKKALVPALVLVPGSVALGATVFREQIARGSTFASSPSPST
jgi:hypothetical protein